MPHDGFATDTTNAVRQIRPAHLQVLRFRIVEERPTQRFAQALGTRKSVVDDQPTINNEGNAEWRLALNPVCCVQRQMKDRNIDRRGLA